MMKVKMTNHHPQIFRASDDSGLPKFPFDISIDDDYSGDELCPSCLKPFVDHNDRQLVYCALKRVRVKKR